MECNNDTFNNYENTIEIRKARLRDVEKLSNLYLSLSESSRRYFHPFPFQKRRLELIFLIMILSERTLRSMINVIPRLGYATLVVTDRKTNVVLGFAYLSLRGREGGYTVANRGIVTKEGLRNRGIGSKLDFALVEYAKSLGIDRFIVVVLTDNAASLALHKKLGYSIEGDTYDEYRGIRQSAYRLKLELNRNSDDE